MAKIKRKQLVNVAKGNTTKKNAANPKVAPKHGDNGDDSRVILMTLENNKRYAHTASSLYQLTMASLQPDSRRLPNCACNTINEERRVTQNKDKASEEKVMLIVEHNLNEYLLCILDLKKNQSCKLNLIIQPGEQIAFRTIGKTPVLLTGISLQGLH